MIKVFWRRSFPMYPYFALCMSCWSVGKPARTSKKAKKLVVCKCQP